IFPNVPVHSFMPMGLIVVLVISIANGLIIPAANTLVSRKAGKEKQGAVLGSLQSFSSLSRTAGPLLSGYLFMMFYTLPFYTGAGIMCFCLIMALVYFKRGDEAK
ncbi:MAG TPA: MFS transporter, partial [Bacteroidia bacterium]